MWVTGFKLDSYGLHFCAVNQTAFCNALQLLLVGVVTGGDDVLLGDAP